MVFNSDIFLFLFLPVVFAAFWILKTARARYILLALSGYVFYGYWNWRFVFLLLFSSVVSFSAGLAIERATTVRRRRTIMAAAVTIDLVILGIFKYYDFFAVTLHGLVPDLSLPLLRVALPVGISFYTFHTISYVVDVAERRVTACRNVWEYLAYVNLFSQLVAGPIVRFRQIEEDLEHLDGPPREDWLARGIGLFLVGLAKKVMVADQIASRVNPILANYHSMSTIDAWTAALGYTVQLYFDFSGYSDMAVGLGLMFGLRIPRNFNSPYRAAGIADFWRRWHISLSSFLRDYIYIPLGGSRLGAVRTYVNLMIVMLLGGLWHGANWTFVVWGAYHGALLAVDRLAAPLYSRLPRLLYQVQTFGLVVIGWILFRSTDFAMALVWLRRLVPGGPGGRAMSVAGIGLIGLGLGVAALVPEPWEWSFGMTRRWAFGWSAIFVLVYLFMNGSSTVFLYYQF